MMTRIEIPYCEVFQQVRADDYPAWYDVVFEEMSTKECLMIKTGLMELF